MKRLLFVMACLCVTRANVFAATLHVPANYGTINDAIQASTDGDEIVVSPGIYGVFDIDRNVTVRSTFDGTDWSIVKNTIIKDTSDSGNIYISAFGAGATIRGFTLTKDPITVYSGMNVNAYGIKSDGVVANVEYCIIENCAVSNATGAAISGINGTIQNNIIRNCQSPAGAIQCTSAAIFNNVLYDNKDGAIDNSGNVFNNTIYNSGGVDFGGAASVFNNILWNSSGAFLYSGPTPRNCVIAGYTGSGAGIITADPKFVDPANGDFRLQSVSPAIDAGLTTSTVPSTDFLGNARVGAPDIGAYEYYATPNAPTVMSATSTTTDQTPTWTWVSGGGDGDGAFRYQMNSTTGSWTTTTTASYTPENSLANGTYTLYVEESNSSGNWSMAGYFAVTVDTLAPNAPIVTVKLPTPMRPVWSWTSGGGGNGTFGHKLDSGAWTNSKATVYVATTDLTLGTHVLYVHERDAAGNWSAISKCSVVLVGAAEDWQGYR